MRRNAWCLFAACLLAAVSVARPAGSEEIKENEALVMRLVFEDCLGFLRHGRTPFEGLPTRPAPAAVARQFPPGMPDRNQIVELLSPRYAAAWGGDGNVRHCIVRRVSDSTGGLLGVRSAGFVARMTARAASEGLTEHPAPGEEFSPIDITTWAEPDTGHDTGPLRPIRIVVMPMGGNADRTLLDAGLVVASGPP